MAGSSLLVLLDDIAAILDDVSVMSKMAAKKTAGVLGDDLAVNAEKVTGVKADRELPVVWAVAVGSLRNKCILVPAALLIAAFADWLITPLLICGGLFLCYEGTEAVWHALHDSRESRQQAHEQLVRELARPDVDPVQLERSKIRGAIRTDFILSAEIIVITLGIVASSPLVTRILVLSAIALAMTVGVYGLVAGIVKLDDAGLYLSEREGEGAGARLARALGAALLAFAPWLMKSLSVLGTAAMFLVGGGILVHGLHWLHVLSEQVASYFAGVHALAGAIAPTLFGAVAGLVAGSLLVLLVSVGSRLKAAFAG
jgi:predicted DNA repair protein MutK